MNAPAKINLFLKILKKRSDGLHELASRFVKLDEFYDEVYIISADLCKKLNQLKVHQVKDALLQAGIATKQAASLKLVEFAKQAPGTQLPNTLSEELRYFDGLLSNFYSPTDISKKVFKICQINEQKFKKDFCLVLLKNIPTFAGLGSASSDAASICALLEQMGMISNSQKFASLIGADVAFFAAGAQSANVRGFGDEIEPITSSKPAIKLHFGLASQTAEVFKEFAKAPKYSDDFEYLLKAENEQILNFEPMQLNDLYAPMLRIYPQAQKFADMGMFLSGSGGSFFTKIKKD